MLISRRRDTGWKEWMIDIDVFILYLSSGICYILYNSIFPFFAIHTVTLVERKCNDLHLKWSEGKKIWFE